MEGAETHILNVWDSTSGKTHEVCKTRCFVQCLTITSDDLHLFYSAGEGVVCQYNLQTGEQVCCLQGGKGKVCHIEVRADDKYLLVLKQNLDTSAYFIELWHLLTGRHHAIKINQEGSPEDMGVVELLVLSHDEELLASKTSTPKVHVWSLKKRQILQTLDEVGNVRSMVFTKSGEFLVTGANDRVIKVWSIAQGTLYKSIYVYGNVVKMATNSETILAATEVGHLLELSIHRGSDSNEERRKSIIHGRKSRLCCLV
ncbi:hypothetical protein BSL78_09181 [Apostichopus japonicus]|uniref:Uncharacterized protein n=1 Tax=Stichopus japonicus TaxID=307972 RepID=A0A2G8L122_STIJA|nr:hypothetical protein BSL78_09181 [Apostichopus japonicus]